MKELRAELNYSASTRQIQESRIYTVQDKEISRTLQSAQFLEKTHWREPNPWTGTWFENLRDLFEFISFDLFLGKRVRPVKCDRVLFQISTKTSLQNFLKQRKS